MMKTWGGHPLTDQQIAIINPIMLWHFSGHLTLEEYQQEVLRACADADCPISENTEGGAA